MLIPRILAVTCRELEVTGRVVFFRRFPPSDSMFALGKCNSPPRAHEDYRERQCHEEMLDSALQSHLMMCGIRFLGGDGDGRDSDESGLIASIY